MIISNEKYRDTVYMVYLVNIKFVEVKHECKLADIQFGEQNDIDVDYLTNIYSYYNQCWRTLKLAKK